METQHLASKGATIPGAIVSGLSRHICEDWDEKLEAMAQLPPEPEYVTTQSFEMLKWLLGGAGASVAAVIGWIVARLMPLSEVKAVLEQHIKDDERRHEELSNRLALEHMENQKRSAEMEARLSSGQTAVLGAVEKIRDSFEKFMWRQMDVADRGTETKRRNGGE